MAINVTVAGVGGTTVTLPWTSVTNAAAAQAALAGITNLVRTGTLEQVNYTGGGTLPPITAPATEGGVIATDSVSGLSPFGIGGGGPYVSAVVGSSGPQTVLVNFGANNETVVSGAGGSTVGGVATVVGNVDAGANVGNLGTNTQVFFGGAATQNFSELGLGAFGGDVNPTATVWVTTPLRGVSTFDDSSGSTTINLDTVASTLSIAHPFGQTLVLLNSGDGQTTVNIGSAPTVAGAAPTDGDVLSFRGTSTVPVTVNAAGSSVNGSGGVQLWALLKSGNALINGNGSEVIVIPTGATGAVTLFGGHGTDIVAGASGLIEAGTGGNSVLFGSTASGSATLVGGGSGDVLVTQGANDVMTAGAGNESLFAEGGHNTVSGFLGAQPAGANTFMQGLFGGDTFITGNGSGTTIFSANDSNGGNLFKEGVQGAANNATINGFAVGVDTISLANPTGGNYSLITGPSTVAPTPGQVSFQYSGSNTEISFGDGTTWTVIGAQLHNTDFK